MPLFLFIICFWILLGFSGIAFLIGRFRKGEEGIWLKGAKYIPIICALIPICFILWALPMIFIICFGILLGFSGIAFLIGRFRKGEEGIWLKGAKYIPIICALMPICFILWALPMILLASWITVTDIKDFKDFFTIILLLISAGISVLLGVWVFYMFTRSKFTKGKIFGVYVVYFLICLCVPVGAIAIPFFMMENAYMPWRTAEIPSSPSFYWESRPTHISGECDFRIRFKSGKTVGLFYNTGGNDSFVVSKYKDGRLRISSMPSDFIHREYLVDPKAEKVWALFDDVGYKLGSNFYSGNMGSSGDTYRAFYTYKTKFGSEEGTENIVGEKMSLPEESTCIGSIHYANFRKTLIVDD